jgi:hypothetical protein
MLTFRYKIQSGCAFFLVVLVPFLSQAQLSCTTAPSGMVAWWAGEGNAYDLIGANNGTLMGSLGFASGEVGQAFNFKDTNGYVFAPASSQLNVGTSSGFTVEEWINPSNVITQMPLIGWGTNAGPNPSILAGPVLNPANGHYYYLLQTNTWTASEPQAVALGGHLATINDAAENSWVLNTFSLIGGVYRDLWIGLYDPAGDTNTVPAQHGTNFVWTDGETATYRNWRSGEPNNGTSASGALREYWTYMFSSDPKVGLAGQWNDLPNYNNDTGGYSIGGVVEVLTTPGVHLWTSVTWPGGGGAGCLYANLVDATNGNHQFASAPGLLHSNVYQHVALTYSTNSGIATLYLNGVSVASTNFGVFVPKTTGDVVLGKKVGGLPTDTYSGGMDEVSIYNRALSASEIQTVNFAGIAGKCPPIPPSILSQPTNQTVFVGQTATFSMSAGGTSPLNYQWRFGITNIANATNTTLVLTHVQLSQAGNYSVQVNNVLGATNSVAAILNVLSPPTLQTLMTTNNLQLTWPVSSGSFLLQSADNLSGPWSNVAVPIITNGSSATVTVQATNQQQFYRLISQ